MNSVGLCGKSIMPPDRFYYFLASGTIVLCDAFDFLVGLITSSQRICANADPRETNPAIIDVRINYETFLIIVPHFWKKFVCVTVFSVSDLMQPIFHDGLIDKLTSLGK